MLDTVKVTDLYPQSVVVQINVWRPVKK